MAGDGQGLGEEIRVIAAAGDEHSAEVTLSNPVPDPMPAHVNWLWHFEVDAIGRETDSDLIVAEDWGRGLGVGVGGWATFISLSINYSLSYYTYFSY